MHKHRQGPHAHMPAHPPACPCACTSTHTHAKIGHKLAHAPAHERTHTDKCASKLTPSRSTHNSHSQSLSIIHMDWRGKGRARFCGSTTEERTTQTPRANEGAKPKRKRQVQTATREGSSKCTKLRSTRRSATGPWLLLVSDRNCGLPPAMTFRIRLSR
jgi:hypothetical protein